MAHPQSLQPLHIQVKFFASLRERLGRGESALQVDDGATVLTVWQRATGEEGVPERLLVAVNMEYVDWDHGVRDGDEVAFFPPVTGG